MEENIQTLNRLYKDHRGIVNQAADSLTKSRCISSKGICTPVVERSTTPTSISPSMSACTALKSRLTRRATSRMVISPAPAISSMICMRFGDSFFQSNSALGNVMDSPIYSVEEKPALNVFSMASNGSLRSMVMVNVRIVLPPAVLSDIDLEVLSQLVDAGECGGYFGVANMLVIAFAGFVVVTNGADAILDISQAVFVVMLASHDRRGNKPDNDFNETSVGEVFLSLVISFALMMGNATSPIH